MLSARFTYNFGIRNLPTIWKEMRCIAASMSCKNCYREWSLIVQYTKSKSKFPKDTTTLTVEVAQINANLLHLCDCVLVITLPFMYSYPIALLLG